MVFNATTSNNILIIVWGSVLVDGKTASTYR